MAPTSNMRKSSTTTANATEIHPNPAVNSLYHPRRSNSGRAIRVNATRPANYYARPFGSFSAGADNDPSIGDALDVQPHGFYPGLQYFTDAITALPKEVMKQFTLMKEVEAKIHGPSEKLGELIDTLMTQPVPRQKQSAGTSGTAQGLLSFTAHNSISGSTNASMVNGVAGRTDAQASVNGSISGEDLAENQEEIARRMQYMELCKGLKDLIPNLDEKHGVLEEANRVLALQELRLDSVMPHLADELSEEARLGSMTHWAYSDNRQKRQAAGAASRRDVAATNSLAAAASLIHEHEISTARRDAGREATRDKAKGKRTEHPADSDFDERPKKQKLGKSKGTANISGLAASGLGISANGDTGSKRKKAVDKGPSAAGMERTVSAPGRSHKASRDPPRSTPAGESAAAKKASKTKPVPPAPKRKHPVSAQASPMLASSPLASSFTPAATDAIGGARPQSARLRHNSGATNLRHEKLQDDEPAVRPPAMEKPASTSNTISNGVNVGSSDANSNGVTERLNGRRKPAENNTEPEEKPAPEQAERQNPEGSEKIKRPDPEIPEPGRDDHFSGQQSGSNSNKNSGRVSAVGTPKLEESAAADVAMVRTRSTRSKPTSGPEGRESSSSEPGPPVAPSMSKHKRAVSNSHLVKQLAPFNRSPDLDRHRSRDDMDEELESGEDKNNVDASEPDGMDQDTNQDDDTNPDRSTRRASARRPISRRNTGPLRSSPPAQSRESTPEAPAPSSQPAPPTTRAQRTSQAVSRVSAPAPVEEDEEEDDDSEHDPDDPNEPKYCYCNRGSYGEMVACDNHDCPREWFHLGCTELPEAPGEEEVWYCRECRPKFARKNKSRSGR